MHGLMTRQRRIVQNFHLFIIFNLTPGIIPVCGISAEMQISLFDARIVSPHCSARPSSSLQLSRNAQGQSRMPSASLGRLYARCRQERRSRRDSKRIETRSETKSVESSQSFPGEALGVAIRRIRHEGDHMFQDAKWDHAWRLVEVIGRYMVAPVLGLARAVISIV